MTNWPNDEEIEEAWKEGISEARSAIIDHKMRPKRQRSIPYPDWWFHPEKYDKDNVCISEGDGINDENRHGNGDEGQDDDNDDDSDDDDEDDDDVPLSQLYPRMLVEEIVQGIDGEDDNDGSDREQPAVQNKINPYVFNREMNQKVHKTTMMRSLIENKKLSADRLKRYQDIGKRGEENAPLNLTEDEWSVGINSDVLVRFVQRVNGRDKIFVYVGRIRRMRCKTAKGTWVEYKKPIKLSYSRSEAPADIYVNCFYYKKTRDPSDTIFTFNGLADTQDIHVTMLDAPANMAYRVETADYEMDTQTLEIVRQAAMGRNDIWGS